jgi:tetratricopeptide (TPR) repeat protein
MLTSARRAFEFEANRDSPWRTTVHVLLGFALVRSARFEEAREPLLLGAELASKLGLWMDAVGARTLLGRVELETGNPDAAERYARDAIDLADERGLGATPTFAYAQTILGLVLVRRGDPTAAAEELEQALPAIRALGEPLSIAESLLALAQARRAVGRRAEAVALQREAGTIIDSLHDPGAARGDAPLLARRRPRPGGADQVSKRELEVLRAMAKGFEARGGRPALRVL